MVETHRERRVFAPDTALSGGGGEAKNALAELSPQQQTLVDGWLSYYCQPHGTQLQVRVVSDHLGRELARCLSDQIITWDIAQAVIARTNGFILREVVDETLQGK